MSLRVFPYVLIILWACSACNSRPQYVVPDIGPRQNLPTMQVSGLESIPARKVRHFAVYKSGLLVLQAEDKPGVLLSTAHPGPEGPAKHEWINAQAYRSTSEHALGTLLRQATHFDGFLQTLLEQGYDLWPIDAGTVPATLPEGHRLANGDTLLGVIWNHPGQFSTLQQQPEAGAMQNPAAAMTVYAGDHASALARVFRKAGSYASLLEALKGLGFKVTRL